MPFVTAGGFRQYYRLEGKEDLPVLVFSHCLGQDHGMWDQQTADLLPHFRILRYDIRGHGATDVVGDGCTIEMLARDLLALVDALGIGRFAFCGLSIGGMIGQWLGANAGDRLTHLVLANTSPKLLDPSLYESRRKSVLADGVASVESIVIGRCFSPEMLTRNPPCVGTSRRTLLAMAPAGYAACCVAIRDHDQTAQLSGIRTPALVICGDYDVGMPWEGHSEVLASRIPGAQSVQLPAAHISNLETPRSFSAALFGFLIQRPGNELQAGSGVRRAVLGDAHVDRATAAATPLARHFQDFITQYAWGSIWTRPGLDHRTRRLLVLAIAASLGRWEEFRLHVKTGLAHELEPCDLEEVLLQTAIYAGLPAANTAFHIASEEQAASKG